jgi:O-antigen ligase
MRSSSLVGFSVFCAILGDRLLLPAGGGSMLPLVPLMAAAVAAIAVWRGGPRTLWFMVAPGFLIGILPYLLLTISLPIAGVVVAGFPDRTMLAILSGVSAFSFLVIGAALSADTGRSCAPWLLIGITLQLAYSIGQAASLGGGVAAELFAPLRAWDLSLVDIDTYVQARSTGLYLNPNELGFWAALATVLAWTLMRGKARYLGVVLAIATLVLSESRGSIIALVAATAVGSVLAWRRGTLGWHSVRTVGLAVGLIVLIVVAVFELRPSEPGATRLTAIFGVLTQGAQADSSLSGRIDFWQAVLDFLDTRPFGSLGPPELAIGSAIDNDWFRALARGSVPYLGAMALVVLTPLTVRRGPRREALWLATVVVVVAATSQIPFDYPPIVLFWLLMGTGIQSQVRMGRLAWGRDQVATAR